MGLRSNHPTHSYYFIGKEAKRFCRLSNAMMDLEILIKLNKNISLNINTKGLPTFHLAENILVIQKYFG